jgi:aspartate/methionine/tyrosine aminotransferase
MDTHETTAKYNIAETCAASISLDDLASLAETRREAALLPMAKKLVYGEIRGSTELRNNLAALYSARASSVMDKEDILIMPGAIAANFLVLQTLVGPGDHVICHYPTYEQLINVPRALGAETSLWKADPSQKWQLNVDEVKRMIKPQSTKLIILNNPNNPTGAIIPKSSLESIVAIAREHNIVILSDEVYRPIFHSIGPMDDEFPPSAINLGYNNVVVTGSLSKAYSLAGIRVGWIACRNTSIIEACAEMRHYQTISVSALDQVVAAEALSERCIHALLARNIQLAKTNLAMLESFIEDHRWACSWIPPLAGTTAFVKFARNGTPIDDEAFCKSLQEKAGVLLVPGSRCFGEKNEFKGYVRVGFVQESQVLKEGLAALAKFMEDEYESVPIASKS